MIMKTRLFNVSAVAIVCLVSAIFCLSSCKDEVDQGDIYTFTGSLMSDYLENDSTTTYFSYLTKRVRLSSHS